MERRDFLKVLGVAGAGAAATGCSTEPDRLIPYLVQPEQTVPGMATYYRTTCRECPAGCGMTIRTREGRAVKAEGTASSPISHGKLCARGQASLHGLYDPDRVPQALVRDGESWSRVSWDRAEQSLAEALAAAGESAVFLTRPETGALDRLLDEWCEATGVRRVTFEGFGHGALREANRRVHGRAALPIHDFANAEVVLSFGADFMETWLSPVDYSHGFVEGHAYGNGERGRFISVTPHQSLTDLNADVWIAPRPGTEHLVALAVARLVADERGAAGAAAEVLAGVDPAALAGAAGVGLERIQEAAHDMASRPSLAVGPGVGTSSAAAVTLATAVAVLNQVSGAMGRTVRLGPADDGGASHADMAALVDDMAAGRVAALLVRGPNPLYELPAQDRVSEALDAVGFIASFSPWLDETSQRAHLLLPDHHFLESWGDHEPRPGVHALVQPVMTPVFETKQTGDVLLSVARRAGVALPSGATTYYDYLRGRWRELQQRVGDTRGFDAWWTGALQKGTIVTGEYGQDSAPPAQAVEGGLAVEPAALAGDGELHLVVYPSYRFYDGRTANRPWLQELPDPISKHTWGTVLEMHPTTAEEYGVDNGHIVEVSTAHGTVELPVWRHPGVRPDTIAIQLGQGHTAMGRYAKDRGVNPIALLGPRYDEAGGLAWVQARADVVPTGRWERQPFSSEQDDVSGRHVIEHVSLADAIEAERAAAAGAVAAPRPEPDAFGESQHEPGGLVGPGHVGGVAIPHGQSVHPNDAARASLQESGGFAPVVVDGAPQDYPPPGTHYGEYTEEQPRWAMAVDMERCIGCSACQTACQAENNIGMVGPDLVAQGRLIQWIRIERYFDEEDEGVVHEMNGGAGHRKTTFLPMMCQQCGNAPCEPVCPVYASYHTPDGLNAQVYNRCVGTRYCANNCPYKVRYFNYFSYEWPEPLNWQLNPDVTVREKGIMEKCTFCVQRIRHAEHEARTEGRAVRDGEIVPACAQTCPGNAIVFGNIKDPSSRVARVVESSRGFRVFEELNTQSAVVYLKKVTEGGEGAAH